MLRRLDAELDEYIKTLWVEFEFDVQLKERLQNEEILEMGQARGFEFIKLNQLISQVETELNERLERTPVPVANEPSNGDKADLSPKTSDSKGDERNRGFFTNSISTDTNAFYNALDPTTLAVIGILLTLAASMIQLVKGN